MSQYRSQLIEFLVFGLLFGLFASQAHCQEKKKIQVDVLAKTTSSWDGKPLPRYSKGKPEITILKITIPPKTKLPLHKHPVINAGVLLKGRLTVVTQTKKTLHLKAGDSIVEVVDTWHYGINDGKVPAVIIVFYAGARGTPNTVKKSDTKE